MTDWLPSFADLSQFRFLRPGVLLALLLLPLTLLLLGRARAQRGAWAQLVDPALQRFVLTQSLETGGRTTSYWGYVVAALLILALAGPTWEQLPQPVYTQQRPVVVALDLSQSMNAQDLIPTRLQVAKIKLRDILRQRLDGQTALITFAGDAFLVTPLTDDTQTIVSMLPSLSPRIMPAQGSRLAPALEMAQTVLNQAGGEPGEVVLISDGVVDRAEAEDAATQLARTGHRVSVIALGTSQGGLIKDSRGEYLRDRRGNMVMAPLQLARLQAVARAGGGATYESNVTDQQLEQMLTREFSEFTTSTESEQEFTTDLWREQGPLLVLLCLPFVALAFRRGVLLGLAVLVFMPQPVHAGVWSDAWKRSDQQGAQAFEQEQYSEAAERFKDKEWQAAALYRAGRYEESAAALNGIESPDAHYNRGNALARAQSLKAAIEAYERTLELAPDHDDAEFNLELLKKMQQEQQNQEQEQEQQQDQDGEQQEPSDQQQDGEGESSEEDGEDGEQQEGESSEEQDAEEQESEEGEGQTEEEREAERERMQAQLAEQMTEEEQQQAVEQWLRRIPDDPGGLLRRKFKRQFRERGPAPRRSGDDW